MPFRSTICSNSPVVFLLQGRKTACVAGPQWLCGCMLPQPTDLKKPAHRRISARKLEATELRKSESSSIIGLMIERGRNEMPIWSAMTLLESKLLYRFFVGRWTLSKSTQSCRYLLRSRSRIYSFHTILLWENPLARILEDLCMQHTRIPSQLAKTLWTPRSYLFTCISLQHIRS